MKSGKKRKKVLVILGGGSSYFAAIEMSNSLQQQGNVVSLAISESQAKTWVSKKGKNYFSETKTV